MAAEGLWPGVSKDLMTALLTEWVPGGCRGQGPPPIPGREHGVPSGDQVWSSLCHFITWNLTPCSSLASVSPLSPAVIHPCRPHPLSWPSASWLAPPPPISSVPSGCLANAGGVSLDSRSDHDVPLSHSAWVASPQSGRVVSLWVHKTLLSRGGKTTSNLLFIF